MFPLQCAPPYINTLCIGPVPIKSQSRHLLRTSSYGLWLGLNLEKISSRGKIKIDLTCKSSEISSSVAIKGYCTGRITRYVRYTYKYTSIVIYYIVYYLRVIKSRTKKILYKWKIRNTKFFNF